MFLTTLAHHYLIWHYSAAFAQIWHVYQNFIWFTIHFFSLPQLFRSLFSPWRRMTEERGKGFHFEEIAAFIIINLFSRLVGALIRGFIILAGLSALILITLTMILFYSFWLIAPAGLVVLLYYGLVLLFI